LKHLGFFLREAATNVARGGILTAAAALAITLASLVAGIFGTAYYNLRTIYDDAKRELFVDVYLKDEVTPERAEAIGVHLRRLDGVARADFVSREDAAREFAGLFPEDKELLAAAGANPLPASYRVHLLPAAGQPDAVAALVKEINGIDGVDDAVYGQEWLASLEHAAEAVATIGAAVGAVLAAAAILVVMSTIGLAVYARRETIAIMKVVGATDAFVRAPFLFEGFFIGVFGGVVALIALYVGANLLGRWGVEIKFLPASYVLLGLLGAGLGAAFGSYVAVRRFLRV